MPETEQGEMPITQPDGEMPEGSDVGTKPSADTLQAELEDTRKALKAANAEAADRRKRLQAFEDAEAKRKESEMSEIEKLQAKLSDKDDALTQLQTNLLHTRFSAEIQRHATKLRFRNPEDAAVFLQMDAFEVDDKSNFKGVESALKELAKERPYLIEAVTMPDTDGTRRNQGKSTAQSEQEKRTLAARYGIKI